MAKIKTLRETAYMLHSESKGSQTCQESLRSLKRRSFFSFFGTFSLSNAERLPMKVFLKVTLVSLTLRPCTVF